VSTDFANPGNCDPGSAAGIKGDKGGEWRILGKSDKPFVAEPLPSGSSLTSLRIATRAATLKFKEQEYAARWWAMLALHDFMTAAPSWHVAADAAMVGLWPDPATPAPDGVNTTTELNDLATLAVSDRPNALNEIQAQDGQFVTDFMSLLSMTPGTRPNTYRVLHIAAEVGTYVCLYFKGLYNRPRPSQLRPALMPPLPMPGHSSWPGGHATESWLMAYCIEFVLQDVLTEADDMAVMSANLRALAARIAINREVAGVHYKSDSDAGLVLAQAAFSVLQDLATGDKAYTTYFGKAVTAARQEWAAGTP